MLLCYILDVYIYIYYKLSLTLIDTEEGHLLIENFVNIFFATSLLVSLHNLLDFYILWLGVHLNSFSYAYHFRLIVRQIPILLELRHVKWPYPEKIPEQCFRQFPRGKTMLHINTYQCLTLYCLQYVITVHQ